jgi:hypothetical protein
MAVCSRRWVVRPTNERFMPVPPEAVRDALADAGGYSYGYGLR